jgi:rubrerythrin
MKTISIFALATFLLINLQNCSSDTTTTEMQKPKIASEQQIAAKAETTKPAQKENKKKDDDDDEDDKSVALPVSNTIGTTDAVAVNFKNLQDAFKGETTASAKYAAFSKKAEEEGYHEIAMLFKAASVSENFHANNHKAVLEEAGEVVADFKPEFTVKTTAENLRGAIEGETYEITTMYPEFLTNAQEAGNQFALMSLNYAYKTEKKHKKLYESALNALTTNTVKQLSSVFYVCPTCGNTYEGNIPKKCGISMTGTEKFIKITLV